MEFIVDTIDLEEIKDAIEHMPIVGVTSNPSIVKNTHPQKFYDHMREIRNIIGQDRSLHIQVTAKKAEDMVKEAHKIHEEIDDAVYIKVPVSYEGLKAIKMLKKEGCPITATAIYDEMQAMMALAAGADYLAPYVNRIGNLGNDPYQLIANVSTRIDHDQYPTKIVAASFKGVQQIRDALDAGAQAVTAPVAILKQIFKNPSIDKAVDDFNADWYSMYGKGNSLLEVE